MPIKQRIMGTDDVEQSVGATQACQFQCGPKEPEAECIATGLYFYLGLCLEALSDPIDQPAKKDAKGRCDDHGSHHPLLEKLFQKLHDACEIRRTVIRRDEGTMQDQMSHANGKAGSEGGHEEVLDGDAHETIEIKTGGHIQNDNGVGQNRNKCDEGSDTCRYP